MKKLESCRCRMWFTALPASAVVIGCGGGSGGQDPILGGGYRINRNFALEGGYFDLGRFGYNATTVPAGTLNGSMKVYGLNLDLVGIVPITEKFSAFGRAEVVKTYLVESSEISVDKVTATGAGGSDPVTKTDECKGSKKTKKLITCLAPDRRVEVEVSGTK